MQTWPAATAGVTIVMTLQDPSFVKLARTDRYEDPPQDARGEIKLGADGTPKRGKKKETNHWRSWVKGGQGRTKGNTGQSRL